MENLIEHAQILKFLHLSGGFLVALSLGGLLLHVSLGGNRNFRWRRPLAVVHGLGMTLLLVSGVWGFSSGGLWVYAKLILWLFLGVSLGLVYRLPSRVVLFFWLILCALIGAGYLGVMKPF